ncbi:unnamed protein product [Discula destructiva]
MAATSSTSAKLLIREVVEVDGVDGDPYFKPFSANCTFMCDHSTNTAFFKLRVSHPVPGNKNGSVYLHIPPEQIISISHSTHTVARTAQPRRRLQFLLARPVVLIGPRGWVLPSSERNQLSTTLRAAATRTALAIHLPARAICQDEVDMLCIASADASWTSCPILSELNSLYIGQGGQVVSVPLIPEHSPPPYNKEIERHNIDDSDGRYISEPPAKRQRADTGQKRYDEGAHEEAHEEAQDAVRKLCRDIQTALRSELLAGQASLRAEMLGELKELEGRILAATRQFASDQIEELKTEVTGNVQDEVAVEVTSCVLEQVRDEYELYIDDRVDGIKLEMEAFVKDEMENAQDSIVDRFQEGTWHFRSS